jgi:hypothetical protein
MSTMEEEGEEVPVVVCVCSGVEEEWVRRGRRKGAFWHRGVQAQ